VAEEKWLAANLLVHLDLRKLGDVVRSPLSRSLMRVTSFWIRHLLLLSMQRVLAQPGVVLHQFQPAVGITLVLGGRVVVLTVFGAHDPDNFSRLGFLGHDKTSAALGQPSGSLAIMT
jgi:hypothetical protein